MKLPLSWLQDFTDIKKIPAEKIADGLTLSGSEAEHIGKRMPEELARFDKVVVGQILEIQKHPNADKLQVAKVNISSASSATRSALSALTIVCGASNIAVGQKVPVALIGAALPNGMLIERRKIRDIESEGMLCSAKELGLAEDAAGIYILSQDAKVGESLVKTLGLDEIVFDLDITPNRGDCLSIRGLAREVSALFKKSLLPIPPFLSSRPLRGKTQKSTRKDAEKVDLKVRVEDKKLCPKYSAHIMYDVKVGESPQWMKNRLLSIGIRPINNIVDITNYVMMELGQPLHAFDADKIKGVEIPNSKFQIPNKSKIQNSKLKKTIVVRRAKNGERIIALDNKVYELDPEMLVIADAEKPIAIAGIMGGKDSSVDDETKTIILEAAQFDPAAVRKTSKALNLKSDSSYRFERGIDALRVEQALGRVVELIEQIAGGRRDSKLYDIGKTPKSRSIKTSAEFISNRLGKGISTREIKQILTSLGFSAVSASRSAISAQIPSWRNDIQIPEDIVEEIGRIGGYGNITPTIFGNDSIVQDNERARRQEIGLMKSINSIRNIKDVLIGAGFSECLLYSFYGERHAKLTNVSLDNHFQVANPINPDQIYLRTSLMPRLYEAGEMNFNNFPEVRIFEIGRVFLPNPAEGEAPASLSLQRGERQGRQESGIKNNGLPEEQKMLAGLLVNNEKSAIDNFRTIKSVIEQMGERLSIAKDSFQWTANGSQTVISVKDAGGQSHKIGIGGIIGSNARGVFKIPNSAAFFEISLTKLLEIEFNKKQYKKISEFPAVFRDISLTTDQSVAYEKIAQSIKQSSELPMEIELFDYFADEKKLGKDKKSLAIHLSFQSPARTLTSEEADKEMQKITEALEKNLKAQIRK